MKLGMYEEAGMWCDKGLAVSFYDFWNTWDIAILLRNKVNNDCACARTYIENGFE